MKLVSSFLNSLASRLNFLKNVPKWGGGYVTCRWTGVCRQVSERYPLLITETSYHTHFYDEFSRKTTHLDNFCQFLDNPPMVMENQPKGGPCLENFGPKTHPYGQHIPMPSTYYVPLPRENVPHCPLSHDTRNHAR